MNRVSLFNSPFLLGFDRLEQVIAHVAKGSSDGYPEFKISESEEYKQ